MSLISIPKLYGVKHNKMKTTLINILSCTFTNPTAIVMNLFF